MKRTVSVVGSATVSVEPDCARLNCGVQVRGSNAQDALRRSNEAMHAIIDALQRNGIEPVDIRTTGPNLHPGEKGYFGGNEIAVTVRALDTLGGVIDSVALAGGPNLTMHGVSFSVSDPGAHVPAARRAAMDAARAIATELATAGGAALGEVLTINGSSGYQAPVPIAAEMRMMNSTPVEAGTQEIRVDVEVTYRLVEPT